MSSVKETGDAAKQIVEKKVDGQTYSTGSKSISAREPARVGWFFSAQLHLKFQPQLSSYWSLPIRIR